jgi:hypothetical protein
MIYIIDVSTLATKKASHWSKRCKRHGGGSDLKSGSDDEDVATGWFCHPSSEGMLREKCSHHKIDLLESRLTSSKT